MSENLWISFFFSEGIERDQWHKIGWYWIYKEVIGYLTFWLVSVDFSSSSQNCDQEIGVVLCWFKLFFKDFLIVWSDLCEMPWCKIT